jgi:hypothetical protein
MGAERIRHGHGGKGGRKKYLPESGECIILDITNDFRLVNTGGRRNEKPLTEEQKEHAKSYAISLGMPDTRIVFVDNNLTGYGTNYDILRIGTDVLPLDKRSENPNDNISLKGTIAHEVIGHREAQLKGLTQDDGLLEEVQASIRAARFAPDLSGQERMDLLRDAINRLRSDNIKLRDVKSKLRASER